MQALTTTVPTDLTATRDAFEAALKAQGFGVLSEIDVQAIFAEKLGAEHEGHRILGICSPGFAKEALDVQRDVALLLPCTATLRETDAGTEVAILDPEHAFTLLDDATRTRLASVAGTVKSRLATALDALTAA